MPIPVAPTAPPRPDAGPAEVCRALARQCRGLRSRITEVQRALPLDGAPRFSEIRAFLRCDDLQSTGVDLPDGGRVTLAYLQTLADEPQLWSQVTRPLLTGTVSPSSLPQAEPAATWDRLLHRLLSGWVALLPEHGPPLTIRMGGLAQRGVNEPTTERQVMGPKEALVEKLETNIGLIRNRLRDPALRVEYSTVGRRSRIRVAMLYLGDVARPELVRLTRRGLRSIAVDFIRTSMDVAALTFQHGWSLFPLVEQSERPDRVAAALSQGRLALVVEGSPFALVVPVTFSDFQHDGEASLSGPLVAAYARSLRFLGLFLAVGLPGLYVALLSANASVLPIPLSLTLSATRLAVPYPVATEAVIMLILSDVLAEATTQAASTIGNALAIVGTLIVGQLMVSAQLASSLMMIVVAASVMGSFLTLKFPLSYAPRIWKYVLVVLAAVGGLLGWATGLLLIAVHLASLESAGTPYLAPLSGASSLAEASRVLIRPSRGQTRRRPSKLRPLQRVAMRPGGRR